MTANDYRDLMAAAASSRGLNPPAIVQPADHYVSLNGIRMHYLDWGNPHLPHVVLLHGRSLTAHTWDMAALLLRDRYHLIALDLRGYGDSDWSPEPTDGAVHKRLMTEDTIAFLDYLSLPRFTLVGMSNGGVVAMYAAPTLADRLDAFVLVDVAPELRTRDERESGEDDGTRAALPPGATRTRGRSVLSFESFDHAINHVARREDGDSKDYLRYILFHSLRQLPDGTWTWKEDRRPRPRLSGDELRAAAKREIETLWQAVRGLRVPTMLVRGESSKMLSEADAQRTIAAIADVRYVVVPNAGHSVQTNNPSAFAAALDTFLSERLPRTPSEDVIATGGGQA